ncbi:hypothetical protein [Streptomyces sp. NRRL S-920]|uniref:hypothetical protein n=1 Tax=Streptomyces sp. NRRL S-920 TaxID=1463921 RepID=UPI0004C9C81A|nr:hypothetical protein [Streptomyces sp. NRRL S-920]
MADAVTLAVLGSVAATEGIRFLYDQASEVLRAWRERRRQDGEAAADAAELNVPVVPCGVLDAPAGDGHVDAAVVAREHRALVELSAALSPYALDQLDVDTTDSELALRAGRLRSLLEAVYGQRFTFRGEDREPAGSQVSVSQALGVVEGQVLGAEAEVSKGGSLRVGQQVDTVAEKGKLEGFKGTVGGPGQ